MDAIFYIDITTLQFVQGFNYAEPAQGFALIQKSKLNTAIYFLSPTGNPRVPYTYADPTAYTGVELGVGNPPTQQPVVLCSSFTVATDGSGNKYLTGLVDTNTQAVVNILANGPQVNLTLELEWKPGDGGELVAQAPITLYQAVFLDNTPSPTPGATFPPSTRLIATTGSVTGGGDLSQDRTLELVGDQYAPGANVFYGTDNSGAKGWQSLGTNFVPSARQVASTGSITGGGDLSANRTLALVGDIAAPGNNYYYGTTGAGAKTWIAFPAVVSPTRNILTTGSVTGGGSLASDLTIDLVGDVASPGNSYYYGTSSSGTKGWNALPVYVPLTRNVSTTGTVIGGGALSADLVLGIVNDVAAPGLNYFYGTSGAGTKGWLPFSSLGFVTTSRLVASTGSITGGGDLSSDRTLVLIGDVAAPGNSYYYGTSSSGTKGWNALPVYVPLTRNVNTTGSVTGGGALSGDLTLDLVNDVAAPGNSYYYGTSNAGVKGWNALPVYVPLTRNVNTTGSVTGGGALSGDLSIDLIGDVSAPGNSYYYGTNGAGTKGWYALPVYVPTTRNVNTTGSVTGGGALSSDLNIDLIGDVASPGNSYVYGTNDSGVKGWVNNQIHGEAKFTTGSGTFTVPAGVYWLDIEGVGGGGAGGSCTASNLVGSGGGYGGYFRDKISVTPGQLIAYSIGIGGVGAAATASIGLATATTFGTLVGNPGSNGGTVGTGTNFNGAAGGAGGTATGAGANGDNITGSAGHKATVLTNSGQNGFITNGAGASGRLGQGAYEAPACPSSSTNFSQAGTAATTGHYGAGGSGGITTGSGATCAGGNGMGGYVRLTY